MSGGKGKCLLAVDSGNSRLKWGLYVDGLQQETGHAGREHLAEIRTAWSRLAKPDAVAIANVGGAPAARAIRNGLAHWGPLPVHWLQSAPAFGGVVNGYRDPSQLGIDRWAALVAAWSKKERRVVVVSCGTAITVDALDAEGRFPGGFILPGLRLARQALGNRTALRPGEGQVEFPPRSTDDAILGGSIVALRGAVAEMRTLLGEKEVPCLLTGGDAESVRTWLPGPVEPHPHLVLDGVARLAP